MKINLNEGQESQPKIDKGIPLPLAGRTGRHSKWPFEQMQVGDSFFAPGKKSVDMAGAVFYARVKNPAWKLAMRNIVENGVKGVRVWRTA